MPAPDFRDSSPPALRIARHFGGANRPEAAPAGSVRGDDLPRGRRRLEGGRRFAPASHPDALALTRRPGAAAIHPSSGSPLGCSPRHRQVRALVIDDLLQGRVLALGKGRHPCGEDHRSDGTGRSNRDHDSPARSNPDRDSARSTRHQLYGSGARNPGRPIAVPRVTPHLRGRPCSRPVPLEPCRGWTSPMPAHLWSATAERAAGSSRWVRFCWKELPLGDDRCPRASVAGARARPKNPRWSRDVRLATPGYPCGFRGSVQFIAESVLPIESQLYRSG